MKRLVMTAVVTLLAGTAPALAAGDVEAGKAVFKKCAVCHAVEPGKNKVGPSMAGILGRKAGTVADYKYSTAMQGSGLTWDDPTLHKYLENPKALVPGTKMAFAGLKQEKERDDVIAYLATLK